MKTREIKLKEPIEKIDFSKIDKTSYSINIINVDDDIKIIEKNLAVVYQQLFERFSKTHPDIIVDFVRIK